MAIEMKNITKRADAVKAFVADMNEKALNTSEKMVDNGLEAAGQWQKVAFKAMKTGTILFGKQQELLFHTLEGVKNQSISGAVRFKNLLNIELPTLPSPTTLLKKKEVKEVAKVTKSKVQEVSKKVADVETQTKAAVANTAKKASQKVAKTAENIKGQAVKAAAKASKMADQRLAKKTPKKDDLKVIDGIGPKMETVLNKAGYVSFDQLAKADAKAIKEVLLNESARYKMFEPQEWVNEAKALVKK